MHLSPTQLMYLGSVHYFPPACRYQKQTTCIRGGPEIRPLHRDQNRLHSKKFSINILYEFLAFLLLPAYPANPNLLDFTNPTTIDDLYKAQIT
jgi:hypothetical protein